MRFALLILVSFSISCNPVKVDKPNRKAVFFKVAFDSTNCRIIESAQKILVNSIDRDSATKNYSNDMVYKGGEYYDPFIYFTTPLDTILDRALLIKGLLDSNNYTNESFAPTFFTPLLRIDFISSSDTVKVYINELNGIVNVYRNSQYLGFRNMFPERRRIYTRQTALIEYMKLKYYHKRQ